MRHCDTYVLKLMDIVSASMFNAGFRLTLSTANSTNWVIGKSGDQIIVLHERITLKFLLKEIPWLTQILKPQKIKLKTVI